MTKFNKIEGGAVSNENRVGGMFRCDESGQEIPRLVSKPISGGLWTSPFAGDRFCEWLNDSSRHYETDFIYEIIPDRDCKVLVIDSLEDFIQFDREFKYDFEKMSECFDILYVTCRGIYKTDLIFVDISKFGEDIVGRYGLTGWDCESALFLNPKFTLGDTVRVEKPKKEKGGELDDL